MPRSPKQQKRRCPLFKPKLSGEQKPEKPEKPKRIANFSRECWKKGSLWRYNTALSCSSDEAAGSDCSAWPARDIVAKLVESADILLDAHDYDGHGWELVHEARAHTREWLSQNKEIGEKAANEQQHVHPMTLRECMEAEEPLLDMESVSDRTKSVPDWAAEEIRATWRAARDAGNQLESFRIIERMVDRLGYGRTENNPSLAPNEETNPKESAP